MGKSGKTNNDSLNLQKVECWKVPVVWEMMGYLKIPKTEAPTEKEALVMAEKMIGSCEVPEDGEYLDDSMEIDSDVRDDIEAGDATLMVGKFPAADIVCG